MSLADLINLAIAVFTAAAAIAAWVSTTASLKATEPVRYHNSGKTGAAAFRLAHRLCPRPSALAR
jgi:hypothetical protein